MLGCGVNPITGRRYCDERREALAAKAESAALALKSGNFGSAASNASGAAKHLAIGSVEFARNAALIGMTYISGRGFFVKSGNRRDDDNG
jgi:hypothetical protein